MKSQFDICSVIAFNKKLYESAVNDNADDFPKVAVDAYTTVVIGVKFVSTFVDWGDQSLVPNIGEDARAEDDVKDMYRICGLYIL